MFSFYTPKIFKTFCLFLLSIFFLQVSVLGQATFRITKPVIGTTQICSSNNTNYYNNLSYGFSSNVVNSSGNVPYHFVELSNENGLIQPREIGCFSPYVNVVYVGAIDINGQNLPPGGGYRIRVFSKSPSVYSEYGESFSVLPSPTRPILNTSGSISLCTGASQTLTVTNTESNVSYQWQNYSSNIANATNTTYSATTDGSYGVIATGANGCSIASNSVYIARVSNLASSLTAYLPNNYYGSNPFFTLPNQAFTLRANFNGGKSPYNFTLNDGITNTSETNITYSKEYNLTSPATGSKTYTLTSVTDACGTQLTNATSVRVRVNTSNYCSVSAVGSIAIKDFSIQGTTINNLNSGKSSDGWGEFLSPANINANVNYNFTLRQATSASSYFIIWADLNHNNAFDSDEKIFPTGNTSWQAMTGSVYTGVLKLPSSTYNGDTRLRVMLSDGYNFYYYSNLSCQNQSSGEIEDYILKVFNGISSTTITTDSLPRLGVCMGGNFPVSFSVTGNTLPANTNFRVEASNYSDFSYPTVLGTGQSSPIACNASGLSNYYYYNNQYVRVVPTTTIPSVIINKSPNPIIIQQSPTAYLQPFFFTNWNNPNYYNSSLDRNLSVPPNTGPYGVFANITSSVYPVNITLDDGRILSLANSSYWNNFIKIDSNITANGTLKYKITQVSNRLCTNNTLDSILIRSGNPYLKIMKVTKSSYNDTTSINKLCGYFSVKFAGDFLDTLSYKFYHVQISDANGSFANPQDIGHVCIYKVLTEAQGGQYISCSIPANLPFGNGYRLRVVKKTGNLVSPVFSTVFEVLDPNTTPFTANMQRSVINEGEVTALTVNFTAGTPPYSMYLNSSYYATVGNSTSLTINLGPVHGSRYEIYSYGGNLCGNSNRVYKYIDVRTLDRDNAQWYIKPIYTQYYEFLRNIALTKSSDTLFKKSFAQYYYSTAPPNAYYDYNSNSLLTSKATVRIGETYSLAQTESSSSSYNNNLTGVWVDANQDGDFDDAGEELFKSQFNNPWNTSAAHSFTIPNNVSVGFSRIRVRYAAKGYNAEPFDLLPSNVIEKYGATYDIPIVVLSSSVNSIISTPKIAGNTLCNGNSFSIDYVKYGIPAGTNANVELSDANGNFGVSPIIVGQGTTSTVNVTLPLNSISGNYKVRVVSNGVVSPPSPPFNVTANTLLSMVDGDWHAGSTWSCGRIPTYVDDVTVSPNTTVTVFSGDARVGSIITNGVLSFLNGTTLRFNQP